MPNNRKQAIVSTCRGPFPILSRALSFQPLDLSANYNHLREPPKNLNTWASGQAKCAPGHNTALAKLVGHILFHSGHK